MTERPGGRRGEGGGVKITVIITGTTRGTTTTIKRTRKVREPDMPKGVEELAPGRR